MFLCYQARASAGQWWYPVPPGGSGPPSGSSGPPLAPTDAADSGRGGRAAVRRHSDVI